jgi:hypothetical protein
VTWHGGFDYLYLLCRFGPLLVAELEEEQRVVRERLASWPLRRLQSEGLVLMGLVAK